MTENKVEAARRNERRESGGVTLHRGDVRLGAGLGGTTLERGERVGAGVDDRDVVPELSKRYGETAAAAIGKIAR